MQVAKVTSRTHHGPVLSDSEPLGGLGVGEGSSLVVVPENGLIRLMIEILRTSIDGKRGDMVISHTNPKLRILDVKHMFDITLNSTKEAIVPRFLTLYAVSSGQKRLLSDHCTLYAEGIKSGAKLTLWVDDVAAAQAYAPPHAPL